jgi:phospholipid/cholesterol/gamma-HCH transport system substrate-binding protein
MLTRFVRIQLAVFTVASVIGVLVLLFAYIQVPTLLGVGRMTVTLELPGTGGLYRFSNVTYRGAQVGEVTDVHPTRNGAQATLSLDGSARVPADLQAQVHSMSAIGEQYVDLLPRTDDGPYLHDGSVIPLHDTTIPRAIGPVLDQVSALVGSIPKDKLGNLIDETFKGFNGAGYDLGSILDSSAKVSADISAQGDRPRRLVDDSVPLLDSQAATTDAIRTWARSFAGITGQLVTNDPQIRTVLQTGPGAADEVAKLLDQVKPTLPVLLANLTTIGQIGVTYNPALRQVLVLLPPGVASLQSFLPAKNAEGLLMGDAALQVEPPPCLVGFLPPSQWRSPNDTTEVDTPDGLYCKLPQDSPLAVRGARNLPCMGHPGKRAPTVQLCDSDKPYEPLAMRQHALGPYPFDPSLVSQGVPIDDRVDFSDREYAPVEGTPMPPQQAPPPDGVDGQAVAPEPTPAVPPPSDTSPPTGEPSPPGATPSAFQPAQGSPAQIALAQYDTHTGTYVANGKLFWQADMSTTAPSGAAKTWKDLLPQ